MRKYLATLHTKSQSHKKRFSLLVSGGVTLFIFAMWSMSTFGQSGTLAENKKEREIKRTHEEITPLESLRSSTIESLDSIKEAYEFLNKYGR